MKTTNNSSVKPTGTAVILLLFLFLLTARCSENDRVEPSLNDTMAGGQTVRTMQQARSTGSANDYNISLTVDGLTWTYVITKNPGAKDLSHFIVNFQNCAGNSATISNIVWATVNGVPAVLENSEGNTGCNVSAVTTNFVKFDDLASASSYTIVFQTDVLYGNFVGTTAWLKAGTSCFAYPVLAPCCPL